MTIKAIETWYRGYRFRSRLEARWAVALDHLGIVWEYEQQGWNLPSGLRYLPDFWLPDQQAHVEVKGSEDAFLAEGPRYAEAVQSGALPGYELIILGPIPDPGRWHQPYALTRDTDDRGHEVLCLHAVDLGATIIGDAVPIGRRSAFTDYCTDIWSYGAGELPPLSRKSDQKNLGWTHGISWPDTANSPELKAAYTAARSARFEHGQAGA